MRRVSRVSRSPHLGDGAADGLTPDVLAQFPVGARPGRCPACAHEAQPPSRRPRLTGMPGVLRRRVPRAATCRESDGIDDPSGWPTECGCTDAFHGS